MSYLAVAATTTTPLAYVNPITTPTSQEGHELALVNRVTIYSTSDTTHYSFASLVDKFPNLWKDSGFIVDLPPKEWMWIPLKNDWESRMKGKGIRIYPLGTEDRKVVDYTFDELHC
jgi:hypothetical protein